MTWSLVRGLYSAMMMRRKLMNDAETLIDDDISAFLDQGTGNEGEGNAIRPKGKCKAVADHKVEKIGKR